MTKKSRQNLNIVERKELLRWNKKHFSSSLKGFIEANENKEGEGPTLMILWWQRMRVKLLKSEQNCLSMRMLKFNTCKGFSTKY